MLSEVFDLWGADFFKECIVFVCFLSMELFFTTSLEIYKVILHLSFSEPLSNPAVTRTTCCADHMAQIDEPLLLLLELGAESSPSLGHHRCSQHPKQLMTGGCNILNYEMLVSSNWENLKDTCKRMKLECSLSPYKENSKYGLKT